MSSMTTAITSTPRLGLVTSRLVSHRLPLVLLPTTQRLHSAFSSVSSSTTNNASGGGGTGIVMMNMGGPSTLGEVNSFLTNLFSDKSLINLPFQSVLGPLIAKRRTPQIQKAYARIGGGSPIGFWTKKQGEQMASLLDELSPATAPHKFYIAFRYAAPFTEDAIKQMKKDGIKRAIAFSQYPQYSCTTSGSSFNELWRVAKQHDLAGDPFAWSVIDRWPTHPSFVDAVVHRIEEGLAKFSKEDLDKVTVIFSAHSLPIDTIDKGDPYVGEVAATAHTVMDRLKEKEGHGRRFVIAWQSQVGPKRWMGPKTPDVIKSLASRGNRHALVVPIAFTCDHIETLFEIDIEMKEEAEHAGVTFHRAPSLNDSPLLAKALADIVHEHIQSGDASSPQYFSRCAGCVDERCHTIHSPAPGIKYPRHAQHYHRQHHPQPPHQHQHTKEASS